MSKFVLRRRRPSVRLLVLLLAAACSSDVTQPGQHGFLQIAVVTDGVDLDPDGYGLVVGSRAPIPVAINDTVIVNGLGRTTVPVHLDDLAPNCSVEEGGRIEVDVSGLAPTELRIDVGCIRNEGTVTLNVEVTGPVSDPTGFAVSVGGVSMSVTGTAELLRFDAVRGGAQELGLENLATFCTSDLPETLDVVPGRTTSIDVTVRCRYSVEGRILFSLLTTRGWRLHTVAPDGTDLVPFGDPDAFDDDQLRPSISRDGSRIVFSSRGYAYAIDSDGTNARPVPNGVGTTPKISPDGEHIALSFERNIWVMDWDGSNRTQVTSGLGFCYSPDWSPDGERLAFEVDEGNWNLYSIALDGTALVPITAGHGGDDLDVAHRPDGSRLAFHSVRGGPTIVTTRPDGSDLVEVASVGWDPSWSPDGERLAYHNDDPPYGIYAVDVASGQVTPLSTDRPGQRAVHAAWGPPLP